MIRTFFHLGFFYPLLSLKGSGNYTASFPTDAPKSSRQSLTAAWLPSPHVASLTWHRGRGTQAHGPAASGMPSSKARLPFTAWGGAPKPPGVLPGKRSWQEIPRHVRCQVRVVGRGRQRNVPEEMGLLGKSAVSEAIFGTLVQRIAGATASGGPVGTPQPWTHMRHEI